MAESNPNGANGYTSDPREQICWDNYVKSITEFGKGNAYQAAIDAGYEMDTARNITINEWFKERLRKLKRKEIFSKAEKVLDECLEMPTHIEKIQNNKTIVLTDPALIRIKQDTAKFVAERLGKKDGYSTRTELTGEDGEKIKIEIVKYGDHSGIIPTEKLPDTTEQSV